MVVITINRDQIREITVELHSNDDDARVTVGLEEATLADVHEGVTNFG